MASKDFKTEVGDPPADTSAWMVTFSDLLTLMITFFVLLLSMSSMDSKNLKKMFSNFDASLGVLEMGTKGEIEKAQFLDKEEKMYQELFLEMKIIRNILDDMLADDGDPSSSWLKGSLDYKDMVTTDGREGIITLSDSILFEPGSYELKEASFPFIDKLTTRLKKNDFLITIEGHADSTSGGSDSLNWLLSAKRANSVMTRMTKVLGIEAERVAARGFGEYSPLVDNSSPENRARNRRIEIVLSKKW